NFVFANIIIYKSLQYSELFNGIIIGEERKYRKSTLRKEDKEKIAQQIKCYIESNRAYLNPNISLLDLSSSLNINSKFISQTINEKFNQNFFEFINSYRIKYAKELMKDSERKERRILEILYESGFNSKSAFNNAFKKFTGLTPSQYKNQNLHSK
ncbi:MAG: helix-turn-helix domain-containing protein, partial [Ignavibacteriaceae bacterium]